MIYCENDELQLHAPITAEAIGMRRSFVVPTGSTGAVVLVYGNPSMPEAYEVEFYVLSEDCYAIATVEVEK